MPDSKESESSNHLISLIREAFKDAPYPGDNNIVRDPRHCPECDEVAQDLRGKHWMDIACDVRFLRGRVENLGLLTPDAYRFYLPAFLTCAIQCREEADIIPESVVYELMPDDSFFKQRVAVLTTAEKSAIKAYLAYEVQTHLAQDDVEYAEDPLRALEAYWADVLLECK